MIELRRSVAATTVCIIVLAGCGAGIGHEDDGWRPLFDGKTTSGWRGFRQERVPDAWQVVNGALTRVGTGGLPRRSASASSRAEAGDIVTVDQFGDFELTLEWKIAPGGN